MPLDPCEGRVERVVVGRLVISRNRRAGLHRTGCERDSARLRWRRPLRAFAKAASNTTPHRHQPNRRRDCPAHPPNGRCIGRGFARA
jgi:hypothetical protein